MQNPKFKQYDLEERSEALELKKILSAICNK